MSAPVLQVDRLAVDLDGTPVLRDVDVTVGAGELVAVLGANGSGKSTLVRAAVGLIPHQGGTVEVFGRPLERFRDRGRLGYVPQRSGSVAGVPATVREVVMSGRLARRRWLAPRSSADVKAVDDAIAQVDLADLASRPLAELSGGQQQRVLVARGLATEPELLVMDEPTAGIDHVTQGVLTDLLIRLADSGTAILLVAHEVGGLRPRIDRAVVLDHGSVLYSGKPDSRIDHYVGHEHHHHHRDDPDPHDRDPGVIGDGAWK